MRIYHALTFLLIFELCHSDYRLSDSKLLLPYNSFSPVNYTLRGSNGACYQWHSGTPEVATVTVSDSKNPECSSEAVVTAVWQSPHRAVTTIYATVVASGHVVKCDVIVDVIQKIDIETTTQELYLHNTPESLEIVAFDEYGNTFSTLEGVPFEWRIHSDVYSGAADGYSVLRFLTWTESEYATPPAIKNLEGRGMQGHMQLVSGLRTGSAVVAASLLESAYSHVHMSQVRLLVMANAQLSPQLAYLIPNSRLKLHVRVVQQGSDKDIDLPSPQYHLLVNDTNLITLDADDGSTVTAIRYGQTTVTLFDRNVEEALENTRSVIGSETDKDDMLHLPRRRLPTSLIHVVEPAYMRFTLHLVDGHSTICHQAAHALITGPKHADPSSSTRSWVMEIDKQYAVSIDLFDQNNHKIFPTDNLLLDVTIPLDKLKLIETTKNNTFLLLRPLSSGTVTIQALLKGLLDKSGSLINTDVTISGSQDLVVYPPVKIQPPLIVLPWPVENHVPFELTAIGGTGRFLWIELPHVSVVQPTISLTKEGEILPVAYGETSIVAMSSSHPLLCGDAKVIVARPHSIQFVPGPSEVVIQDGSLMPFADGQLNNTHDVLTVGLTVLDVHGRAMADCRNVGIRIDAMDQTIVKVLPERLPAVANEKGSTTCMRIRVIGLTVGVTQLEATLSINPSQTVLDQSNPSMDMSKSVLLKDHFPVASYKPIAFLDPPTAVAYVTLGSTRNFLFTQGPSPWPVQSSNFFTRISPKYDDRAYLSTFPAIISEPVLLGLSGTVGHDLKERRMQFALRCDQIGTFVYTLELGNRPSSSNISPVLMSSDFTIVCTVPAKIQLHYYPALPRPIPNTPACPLLNQSVGRSDEHFLPNTAPVLLSVNFYDSLGNILEAVDSMGIAVSITNPSDGTMSPIVSDSHPLVHQSAKAPSASLHEVSSQPHFLVTPKTLGVTAGAFMIHVESQLHESTSKSKLPEHLTQFRLTKSMSARFISAVEVQPSSVLRLFHMDTAEQTIRLVGGSGHFHVTTIDDSSDSPAISVDPVTFTPADDIHAIQRRFLVKSRRIGRATLRIIDYCFPSMISEADMAETSSYQPTQLDVVVTVVGLSALRLRIVDRIHLGGKTTATVDALDTNGQILPASFTQHLNLSIHQQPLFADKHSSANPVLGLRDAMHGVTYWKSLPAESPGTAHFTVRGLSLGSCLLSVSTNALKVESKEYVTLQSNAVEIQVFAPLKLSPCGFNLLLGAEYELRTWGGPSPSSLEFSVQSGSPVNLKILRTMSDRVLVRAVGSTAGLVTVEARAFSRSSGSNTTTVEDSPVSSHATCTVRVVKLSAIRIGCPLTSSINLGRKADGSDVPTDVRYMIACSERQLCGSTPLWVEGIAWEASKDDTYSEFVNPFGMSGLKPKVNFAWQLNPPQPSSIARLEHVLEGLNVQVSDSNRFSGMVLRGLSSGQITIHVTVQLTGGGPSSMFVDNSGRPIHHLSAQLTIVILPPLRLITPWFHAHRQLLLSPGSVYQLNPWSDVTSAGHVTFELFSPIDQSVSDTHSELISISPDGLLRTSTFNVSNIMAEYRATIQIRSWPKSLHSVASKSSVVQTVLVDVIVKNPRYVGMRTTQGSHVRSAVGLLVGGPYEFAVTFHDELGRTFDGVADDYLHLNPELQRMGLFEAHISSHLSHPRAEHQQSMVQSKTWDDSAHLILRLRVLPQSTNDGEQISHQSVLELSQTQRTLGLWPTYLSIIHGGQLDVGLTDMYVGQWTCLSELTADGVWTSSDTSVLWADSEDGIILARRPGHAYLLYSIPLSEDSNMHLENTSSSYQFAYMVGVSVTSWAPPSDVHLLYVSDQAESIATETVVLPIPPFHATPSTMRFLVQYDSATKLSDDEQHVCPLRSDASSQRLSEVAPLQCDAQLVNPSQADTKIAHSRLLPNWLVVLALWNQNVTFTLQEDVSTVGFDELIKTRLEPSLSHSSFHRHSVQWQCVLRTSNQWAHLASYLGLVFEPGMRLQVRLKTTSGDHEPTLLASTDVLPLPGFQMLIPPAIVSSTDSNIPPPQYHMKINNPRQLSGRLLIFLPPSTASALTSKRIGRDRLVARSKSPSTLDITSPPRPAASLHESAEVIREYVSNLNQPSQVQSALSPALNSALRSWAPLASSQVQQIENEAAVTSDATFIRRNILWIVDFKATLSETAINTVVDVVVSFRPTGQHVVVPIHVHLPGKSNVLDQASSPTIGAVGQFGFTWSHLVALVLITLLVAVIVHLTLRSASLVSFSTGGPANLPPVVSPSAPSSTNAHRLWTKGGGFTSPTGFQSSLSPTRPAYSVGGGAQSVHTPSRFGANAFGDGTMEEQRWRQALNGGSPSRLRDTYDSI